MAMGKRERHAKQRLVKGKTVGIDAPTLDANAVLRSIVRRDTGESYEDFLTKLAQASSIATPTRADLARIDRRRKKKGSTDDWTHPHDPDAKISKMNDDRTHLAYKAEHAVDRETGAIVGVTVQDVDDGDTPTSVETLIEAAEQVETVRPDGKGLEVCDCCGAEASGWNGPSPIFMRPPACAAVHLRGHINVRKRLLIHTGFNLGLLMRKLNEPMPTLISPPSLPAITSATCN